MHRKFNSDASRAVREALPLSWHTTNTCRGSIVSCTFPLPHGNLRDWFQLRDFLAAGARLDTPVSRCVPHREPHLRSH
eukprot:6172340-Pyramimonas_sp.AAC.2